MLDLNSSASQAYFSQNKKEPEFKLKAKACGDWDSRVAQADPDPEMITNSHYWQGYCDGMYQRYLKKYGINRSN